MFSSLPNPEQRATFEEVFFEKHSRLLEWALQLTRRNASEAEDLVQDLFVLLALNHTCFAGIERTSNYLFSVLRNIHYARLRRAGRSPIDDLSIVDFDTVERGLRAIDRSKLLFIRSDLTQICDYLCQRKEVSRSASIFILRYFLGYLPSEIMLIAKSSRTAFDKGVSAARREVRLHIERPGLLLPTANPERHRAPSSSSAESPQFLFKELRSRIFNSCSGSCFQAGTLRSRYSDSHQLFSTEEMAHLVSCSKCLDEANELLELPSLEARSPDDSIGRDTPPGPGSSSGKLPQIVSSRAKRKREVAQKSRFQLERRMQEAFEHRPQKLLIAVDGDIRASQTVSAEVSELQLSLGRGETPTLIEVLSEQGVRIAGIIRNQAELNETVECSRQLTLSDDRSLDLGLSFASESPLIRVTYLDPLATSGAPSAADELDHDALTYSTQRAEIAPSTLTLTSPKRTTMFSRWINRIPRPRMSPLLVSALLFGVVSIVCLVLWMHRTPKISAQSFLEQTASRETTSSLQPGVIYQKVQIRTSGRKFDRVMYRDRQGKRQPKKERLSPADQKLSDQLATAEVSWNNPLSVINFERWHDRQLRIRDSVTKTSDSFLTLTSEVGSGAIVKKETITVRERDFHVVERTISLPEDGTIEIAELEYAAMPWRPGDEQWFEPVPDSPRNIATRPHSSSVALPRSPPTEDELDEADLSVRLILSQLGADTGERITISRQPSGLQVKGIVADEKQKQEMESQLAIIPHVLPSIFTFAEIQGQLKGADSPTSLRAISETGQASVLEEYLVINGQSRDEARVMVADLLNAAITMEQDSRATVSLLREFNSARSISPAAKAKLQNLLELHRTRVLGAVRSQQSVINKMGFSLSDAPLNSIAQSDISNIAEQDLEICRTLSHGGGNSPAQAQELLNQLGDAAARVDLLVRRPLTAFTNIASKPE